MATVMIELKGLTETRELDGRPLVIGRSRSADVRLDHASVSGRHARIETGPDGVLTIVDLDSTHGLEVADRKVDRVAVTDGLVLRIGKARLTFKTGGGQARAECLQRLQLPDPGVSGISPPPAPGSGLGTTRRANPAERASRFAQHRAAVARKPLRAQVADASTTAVSIAIAAGLHGFIALALTVAVYYQFTPLPPPMTRVTLAPPRELAFVPPDSVFQPVEGGAGDAMAEPGTPPPIPTFEDSPNLADDGGRLIPEGRLEDAAAPEAAPKRTVVRPPLALEKNSAMRKFVKVPPLAPDWDKKGPIAKEGGTGGGAGDAAVPNADGGGRAGMVTEDDAVDRVRGNMDRQGRGWEAIAGMEKGEVVVVAGDYDHVQRVLDRLKVPYSLLDARRLGGAKLNAVKVLLLNCPCQLDGAGVIKLRSFVDKGGWVVSTDWALTVIKEAFPGYLRNQTLSPETWVAIEPAAGAENDPLLQNVFNGADKAPRWYLEERSYLFRVDTKAKDKVKVLIESAEMKTKYGAGVVAATFEYGQGRVLHIASHLQQVSTDANAHYAMYQFLVNWLVAASEASPAAPK